MRRVARTNFVQMIAAAATLTVGGAASFATAPATPSQLYIDWNSSSSGQSINPNEERANDALRDVGVAQSEISRTYWLLRHEFNNSGDWQEAVNAAQRAKANFDLARCNALGLLQATPDY